MLSSTLPHNLLKKKTSIKNPHPKSPSPWKLALQAKSLTSKKYLLSLDNSLLLITESTLALVLLDRSHILIASQIYYCDSLNTNLGDSMWLSKSPSKQVAWKWAPYGGLHTPKAFYQVPWRFIILDSYFSFYFSYPNRSYYSFMIGQCLPWPTFSLQP